MGASRMYSIFEDPDMGIGSELDPKKEAEKEEKYWQEFRERKENSMLRKEYMEWTSYKIELSKKNLSPKEKENKEIDYLLHGKK